VKLQLTSHVLKEPMESNSTEVVESAGESELPGKCGNMSSLSNPTLLLELLKALLKGLTLLEASGKAETKKKKGG